MLYPDIKKMMKTVQAVSLVLVALVAVSGKNFFLFSFKDLQCILGVSIKIVLLGE